MENKEFIPHEEALALKELEFDELCIAYYDNKGVLKFGTYVSDFAYNGVALCLSNYNDFIKLFKDFMITAPLYQQAFRWFREKYNLYFDHTKLTTDIWDFEITNMKLDKIVGCVYGKTYEEAELACLRKLIEIVKNVNN